MATHGFAQPHGNRIICQDSAVPARQQGLHPGRNSYPTAGAPDEAVPSRRTTPPESVNTLPSRSLEKEEGEDAEDEFEMAIHEYDVAADPPVGERAALSVIRVSVGLDHVC